MKPIDIAIMTPLAEEWEEMVKHLRAARNASPTVPAKSGQIGRYSVWCEVAGKGQEEMATALTRIIERANPSIVLVVGIAGGFPAMGVRRGDVVVVTTIWSFDYGKLTEGKFIRRPDLDYTCDPSLIKFAKVTAHSEKADWQQLIRQPRPDSESPDTSRCHTDCYLASSNKIIDDDRQQYYSEISGKFPEIHAVDTESVGAGVAARTAQSERPLRLLVIRGISDEPGTSLESGRESRKEWKRYASAAAAAFTCKLIKSLPQKEVPPKKTLWTLFRLLVVLGLIPIGLGLVANDYVRNLCCVQHQSWRFDKRDWIGSSANVLFSEGGMTIPPGEWAALRNSSRFPQSDFSLRFRLSVPHTSLKEIENLEEFVRAEWVLRSNVPENGQHLSLSTIPGDHFQLAQVEDIQQRWVLKIERSVVRTTGGKAESHESHDLAGTRCCSSSQSLDINVVVIGKRIAHCRSLQDSAPQDPQKEPEIAATYWELPEGFRNPDKTLTWRGIVFGASEKSIVLSDIAIDKPSKRELARCFLSGKYCWPLKDFRSCP